MRDSIHRQAGICRRISALPLSKGQVETRLGAPGSSRLQIGRVSFSTGKYRPVGRATGSRIPRSDTDPARSGPDLRPPDGVEFAA